MTFVRKFVVEQGKGCRGHLIDVKKVWLASAWGVPKCARASQFVIEIADRDLGRHRWLWMDEQRFIFELEYSLCTLHKKRKKYCCTQLHSGAICHYMLWTQTLKQVKKEYPNSENTCFGGC